MHPLKRAGFLAPPLVSYAFIINFCSLVYQCGCTSWWAGAAAHCNIHNASGRHCPWCIHGALVFNCVLALILIPQFVLAFWPSRLHWRGRLFAAFAAFPVVGFLAAVALGLIDGYWS